MSSEEKQTNVPGEKDSWETLAENLFGIDFGKATTRAEPCASDHASAGESSDSSVVPGEEVAATGTDDPGEPIDVADSQEPPAAVEETVDQPESGDAASEPEEPAADAYWNALSDWEWDNTIPDDDKPAVSRTPPPSPPRPKSPAKPAVVKKSERSKPAARGRDEQPAPVSRDKFLDDDGFGLGLLDDVPPEQVPPEPEPSTGFAEAIETSPAETADVEQHRGAATTVDDDQQSRAPKRKKRRRRRRRSRETDHAEETADDETADIDPSEESPPAETERDRPDDDDDGDDDDDDGDDGDDDDDDDEGRPAGGRDRDVPSTYRDLPTWEEAVSYLVNPAQSESRTAEAGGGTQGKRPRSKGDSSKSSGRRSRRRR